VPDGSPGSADGLLSRRAALALLLTLSACVACSGAASGAAASGGEELRLRNQIDGLNGLIARVEQGRLTRPDQLLVGVDEALVERLIAVTLPQERTVAERFRIRLEKAAVRFRGNQGLVTLTGRASAEDAPGTFVDVVLHGALDQLTVERDSGALTGRVAIYTLEVQRAAAAGAESRQVRALAEALGQASIDRFAELGPPVVIPIQLHEEIELPGLDEEPVSAAPGSLQVKLEVATVIAVSGRLWVMLDVVAGPWRRKGQEHAP
jgi:hypothetical protein